MNFLTGKIVQAICWTLIHSLWQGLLLAVVTGVVMVLSKRSGSALRYKLLSGIFIAFIAVTGFTFYKQLQAVQPIGSQVKIGVVANTPAITTPLNYIAPVVKADNNSLQYYTRQFVDYFDAHASLIVTIWFIIFMARCVKILSGLVHIQRIRHYKTNPVSDFWAERIKALAQRLNIKKHILLLESALIKVPAVVGFLKPTILVPIGLLNKLSQEEVESILMHELAHIRRKDYLFNLLQCFIDIIFFFNPAVLWISSLIRNERENCCDDIAVNETKSKKQFIQALVSFHQYNAAAPKYAMPFAARKTKLVDRVKRLVNNNNSSLNPGEKIVLVGCLIIFAIAFVTVSNGQTDNSKKKPQQNNSSTTNKTSTQGQKPTAQQAEKSEPKHDGEEKDRATGDDYDINYQALGYKDLTVDKLIELRDHGVDAGFIRELNAAGFKNISLDKAIELKDHGVSLEFIRTIGNLGFKNISLDDAIELRDHGVNTEFINSIRQAGYSNLSLDKYTELKDHGVSVEYINGLKKEGITDLTIDKAIELRDQGLSADFIEGFRKAGYTTITPDEALDARNHGVSVEYINEMKKEGFPNLTLDKAIELRDQGLSGEYISGLRKAGFTSVTPEQALEAKNHGVSIEFINSFKKFGFTDISLDKAIELKDHGVSAAFIDRMKTKTGSYFKLDEYIRLKDNGFDK